MKKTLEHIPVVLIDPNATQTGMLLALLRELDEALRALIMEETCHVVDLSTLPLSTTDRTMLNSVLGEGEMCIDLEALGRSQIRESSFPGVWWVRHEGPDGKLLADHIEVTYIPEIVPAHASDVLKGQVRLAERIEQMSHGSER